MESAHEAVMMDVGQVCVAGSRTYVQAGIYEEFVKRSAERAARRQVGSPLDPAIENGPQVLPLANRTVHKPQWRHLVVRKVNGNPPALRHNFMNIDDLAVTPTMSDNLP